MLRKDPLDSNPEQRRPTKILIALAFRERGGFIPLCDECRADQGARDRFKCGPKIVGGYDELWCPECDGDRTIGGVQCYFCEGSGVLRFKRCPKPLAVGAGVGAFFLCYDLFRHQGVLPYPGGPLKQPNRFVELCRFAVSCEDALKKTRER